MLHISDAVDAWRRAPLGELALRGRDAVDVAVVVPLLDRGSPCLALSYDRLALARAVEQVDEVVLSVTALASPDRGMVVRARPQVVPDPDGTMFEDRGLLAQELAKHPPSRRRIDSLLLRREHWWFMPRLLVRFTDLREARPAAGHALVAVAGDRLEVAPCTIEDRGPGELRLDADDLPDGPAVVLEHGADLPDLERPWHHRWRGRLAGSRLVVDGYDEESARTSPPGLLERLRRERVLERRCRAGLRESDDADPPASG